MLNFCKLFISLILGFVVCGITFGLANLIGRIVPKKINLSNFLMPIASLIPLLILILTTKRIHFFTHPDGCRNCSISLIISITSALCASLIANYKREPVERTPSEIAINCISGMAMEIPQRLLMQSFLFVIISAMGVPHSQIFSYIINSLVWCLGLITQGIIAKQKFTVNFVMEIFASFVFSMGIGMVYTWSGFIFVTMASHGFERLCSCLFQNVELK